MDGFWSRAGAVLTLALVGTLCAAAPALATDGYVKGKKWHDVNANGVKDAGEPVVKDWWIYVDVDRDGVYDTGEPKAKTDASGNYSITGITWWRPNHEPRTYDVRELPVSSQPQALDGCSYPANCKYTLTFKDNDHLFSGKDFGNYKTGKLIVKKVNLGGDQADAFGFTTTGSGTSNFSLAAKDAPKQFGSLKPGTYSVAETADPRYTLTKAECDEPRSNPASIKVDSGETVTCTFTNTRKTGQIKVVKNLIPANDPGTFDLKVNGTTAVTGGNGANATVTVPTGANHSVAETGATLGKYASSLYCTDGTTGDTSANGITVTAGQTTVCTFTNERKSGKIRVVKNLIPATDAGRFDLEVGDDVVADVVGERRRRRAGRRPGHVHRLRGRRRHRPRQVRLVGRLRQRRDRDRHRRGRHRRLERDGHLHDHQQPEGRPHRHEDRGREHDPVAHVDVHAERRPGPGRAHALLDGRRQPGRLRTSPRASTRSARSTCRTAGTRRSRAAADGKVCTQLELAAGESGEFTVDNTTPAIGLLKQVRRAGDEPWEKVATLQVGQTAQYLLTVTNEGVGSLVGVDVADDRCDTEPVYVGGDTDADSELDEPEAWTYRCDHVVTAGDGAEYVNTAEVTATDKRENPVRDIDTATVKVTTPETPPPPKTQPPTSQPSGEQQVLP